MKEIHVIGGGTVSYIRPHLVLAAPAYGKTVWQLMEAIQAVGLDQEKEFVAKAYTTRMAGDQYWGVAHRKGEPLRHFPEDEDYPGPRLETNEDVARLLSELTNDLSPKIIFLPVAMCDFEVERLHSNESDYGQGHPVGKNFPRLRTGKAVKTGQLMPKEMGGGPVTHPVKYMLDLKESEKIIRRIRKDRKDIFLVGFKTTTGETEQGQFEEGLKLVKTASCNLVLANDLTTRNNMIITPEQAAYSSMDRDDALYQLVDMAFSRSDGHFTRCIVADGQKVPWGSPEVPENLRMVVDWCIQQGAYKPFMGATVGHFAFKVDDKHFVTSIRKSNFNDIAKVGMVKVEAIDDTRVIAYGAKPSVGGQSQRIIFKEHPEADCIVHFHCPLKPGAADIPVREQWPHECGSHECGKNTSEGLKPFSLYEPSDFEVHRLKAVMLDRHGPNIVFSKKTDPKLIMAFIDRHWDLSRSTSFPDEGQEPVKKGMNRSLEEFLADPFEDGR